MGDQTERNIVRKFHDGGWVAQRAAASGSATTNELPDVILGKGGIGFAAEEKTTSRDQIYVDKDKIRQLIRYSNGFGMHAVAIGRFKGERAWYFYSLEELERTSKNYIGRKGDEQLRVVDPDGTEEGITPEKLQAQDLKYVL
jgi:Holliday junction resolvase